VVRDITERKQQEAALRESNERFREIAENINEVFWVTNHNGSEMLYVSPAYEKIWGRTCASLYQNPYNWIDSIYPEDRERAHQAYANMQEKGGYDEVYRITQPDGAIRWIHDRGSLLRNAAGEIYRVVGVAEDITQHRKLEEQFRQAQKMEAIGTLAGGIAHDFNNILAAVNGYAELCKMKAGENSPLRDYLDAISHAGIRATALVRQILTFSRQQEQQRRPVRVCDIVDESLKLLRATIPTTIEFVVTKAPQVPTVLADPTQIHQIIMNLGTNAWHAMRDRPGRLEVKVENFEVDKLFAETRPRLRPGPYVRVSIADTGTGMSEATLARIFEPFFTTKPKGEGTGLGLAVVHGIMESHDGVISVYSKPGEGTIFHLYFPAQPGEAIVADAPKGPIPQGQGKSILYLDDEEPLARLGQKTLEQLGYKVTMSTKVAEALEWVRQDPQRFDLVITDQTMPGMTGVDFAAELLKMCPDLPVILTTGYSAYLTTEHVRSLGIRDLLLKPHTIHTLGMAVHHALSGKKPA
jgi:PAS domain S-box-containing protein